MSISVEFGDLVPNGNDVSIGMNHSILFHMLPILIAGLESSITKVPPSDAVRLGSRKHVGEMVRAAMFIQSILDNVTRADADVRLQFRDKCGLVVLACIGEFKTWFDSYLTFLAAAGEPVYASQLRNLVHFNLDETLLVDMLR